MFGPMTRDKSRSNETTHAAGISTGKILNPGVSRNQPGEADGALTIPAMQERVRNAVSSAASRDSAKNRRRLRNHIASEPGGGDAGLLGTLASIEIAFFDWSQAITIRHN